MADNTATAKPVEEMTDTEVVLAYLGGQLQMTTEVLKSLNIPDADDQKRVAKRVIGLRNSMMLIGMIIEGENISQVAKFMREHGQRAMCHCEVSTKGVSVKVSPVAPTSGHA